MRRRCLQGAGALLALFMSAGAAGAADGRRLVQLTEPPARLRFSRLG